MLQDDRVMSILTGLVIVVAMATLAQRSDSLLNFFTREEPPKVAPQNDVATLFAGDSKVIDVLANDENARPEDGEAIRIVVSPSCGAAEAASGGVLYISNDHCVGPQLFAYCVTQGEECPSASVTVNVAASTPGAVRVTSQTEEAPTPSLDAAGSTDRAPESDRLAARTAADALTAPAPVTAPAAEPEIAEPAPAGATDDAASDVAVNSDGADETVAGRAVDETEPALRLPEDGAEQPPLVAAAPAVGPVLTAPTGSARPETGGPSPNVADRTAPPHIAATAGADRPADEPDAGAHADAALGSEPVVAAIRPTGPSGFGIGRIADAPRIAPDAGDVAGPEAPVPSDEVAADVEPATDDAATPIEPPLAATLSDDSEPTVALAPAPRPQFDADEETAATADRGEADDQPFRVAALPPAAPAETDDYDRPDVTAIEDAPGGDAPTGITVARLPEPIGGSTADAVRDDAVRALRAAAAAEARAGRDGATETALRPPAADIGEEGAASLDPVAPAPPAASDAGDCAAPAIRSVAFAGAASLVEIADICRRGETFEVEHAGLRFGGRLDDAGGARLTIPVMDEGGAARVVFADGAETPVTLDHNWRELRLTLRVAVAWTDPVDLDLHAFEYAATFNSDGHVWEKHPSGFRLVRRSGGGYLESFGAVTPNGQSIEVYTFWANSRARRGVARIALDLASRGDTPEGDFCAGGALAAPDYLVVRSERGEVKSTARGRFTPARCGLTLDAETRYASGALRDLRIE